MKPRNVILGPCPCTDCRRLLVWDGEFWLFRGTNIIHVPATCPAHFDRPKVKHGKR